MTARSIEITDERTQAVRDLALAAGFTRARFLAGFDPRSAAARAAAGTNGGTEPPEGYSDGAPALLVVALPYGNDDPDGRAPDGRQPPEVAAPPPSAPGQAGPRARIAPFARRNYYAEAVARLKKVAVELRKRYGGKKADYRILCNSPIPEKPLAEASGLGSIGRNSLVITPEAGSLVILAAMTLPFEVAADGPLTNGKATRPDRDGPRICGACSACVAACPTGALGGDGTLDRSRCLQWYASGHGEAPAELTAAWGDTLYGCTACLEVCPHNRRPIPGVATDRGALPAEVDAGQLLALSDEELRDRFRGTAMGMAWLGPAAIRRNAKLAAAQKSRSDH